MKIDRKDEDEDILDKYQKCNQQMGIHIKEQLENSIVFPNEDHSKKCKESANIKATMSTNKEPEVLCIDMKWHDYLPLDVLTCFNMIQNSMKLSDLFELEGQED